PVLAPLADFADAPRHAIVTAYVAGSGIVQMVTPTSGALVGMLAIGRVPLQRWLRFVAPLALALLLLSALTLSLAVGFR
ncbi:MAG TPA: hypothetical protein VG942_00515, partial [Hyphomonadaceae bacterium]|nr:hypothetical protein [Hyphomonadaceae bacterium]